MLLLLLRKKQKDRKTKKTKKTERQKDRKTERKERQKDRKTKRQKDRKTERYNMLLLLLRKKPGAYITKHFCCTVGTAYCDHFGPLLKRLL
jgi:hypothetical protein